MPSAGATARHAPRRRRAISPRSVPVEAAPPGFKRGLVRRPRLVDRLTGASDCPLAAIVAPAGFGKSTLLAEWAERDRRPFVWLRLAGTGAGPTPSAVASAVEGVRERHPAFVLVVDEADAVPEALIREGIAPLLEQLGEGSTLAVCSRSEPPLPIGRLRAHRALVELRMSDLALTAAEAATLLRRAGIELEFEAVQALVRRTEGWPAALYLATLALRDADELPATSGFGGDDHLLAEFLRDEVLPALPTDLMRFLIRTAMLEELSGPLCDDVLEQSGSALALARLEKQSQLLVPLDRAHDTYRWQRLFKDAMRAELRRSEPELEPRLQLRASAWYARHGDSDRAIEHAVAGRDVARSGELLWANLPGYLGRGRAELLERWLREFSQDELAGDARLALCAAHCALAQGKLEHAQYWALAAQGALARGKDADCAESLRTGLAIVEAVLAQGGAAQMRRVAGRAYEREPDDSPWRAVLCLLKGTGEHLLGDSRSCVATLERGAGLSAMSAPSVASLCLAVQAMVAVEREDWEAADELTDRAGRLLEGAGLDTYPLSALAYAASAAVGAHQGRVDRAKHDLRRGIELLAELGDYIPWYGAQTRILLAHASLWLADVVGARALLAEASRLARKTPDAVIFQQWFDRAWAYMDTLAESSLSGPSSLTIAELRILRFLPSHRSFREIASQLGVSANTVKTQAHAVYRKLGAASRSEAVARALEAGLLGQ
jgi:LuxR family transcriptional regulator, maltose regulon positive regulatory protein